MTEPLRFYSPPDIEKLKDLKYSDAQYKLESIICDIEENLSTVSAVPLVIPGIFKMALGSVQAVSALVIAIFAIMYESFTGDKAPYKYCVVHVKHGMGNILAGFIEAIPIAGTALFIKRVYKAKVGKGRPDEPTLVRDHKGRFMKYPALKERDFKLYHLTPNQQTDFHNRYVSERDQCRKNRVQLALKVFHEVIKNPSITR